MAGWYNIELFRHNPDNSITFVESWQPNTVGAWSDFHLSLPGTNGDYNYELRVSDPGSGGVSNTQVIAMSFKR